jgi:hypothetical protein
MQHTPLLLSALVGLAAPSLAQLPDVAIVAAATTPLTACNYTDVQSKLMASGFFNSVDIVDCMAQTPTLQMLMPYEGIISWSNSSYQNGALLGDVFADYVDAGGGVVLAVYATSTTTANRSLTGRWSTGGYDVIVPRSGNTGGAVSLGNVLIPNHPLMAGVATLTSTQGARPTTTMLNQGQIVAEWSDGKILVAAGATTQRVDLGLYPPSSACTSTFWDENTDGGRLLSNALRYVCGGGTPSLGTNYCTAVNNSTGGPGAMSGTGSAVVLDNDVTLAAGGLPNNAFGFFLTSTTQGFVMNPGGSVGNLCLGGAIGRYVGPGQIQNTGLTGAISLQIDLTQMPTPTGFISVASGETWNFTAWHRDVVGGVAVSNFADGYSINFL